MKKILMLSFWQCLNTENADQGKGLCSQVRIFYTTKPWSMHACGLSQTANRVALSFTVPISVTRSFISADFSFYWPYIDKGCHVTQDFSNQTVSPRTTDIKYVASG